MLWLHHLGEVGTSGAERLQFVVGNWDGSAGVDAFYEIVAVAGCFITSHVGLAGEDEKTLTNFENLFAAGAVAVEDVESQLRRPGVDINL